MWSACELEKQHWSVFDLLLFQYKWRESEAIWELRNFRDASNSISLVNILTTKSQTKQLA